MRRILFVLSSHGELGDTGRPTGWFLPEAAHPWRELTDAGWDVRIASPLGGIAPMDGADLDDPVQQAFLDAVGEAGPVTERLADVDASQLDAVLFVGGHGTMWDFRGNADVEGVGREVWDSGGLVAAVCHGPAALVDLRLGDGSLLVAGRRVAAFTDEEERLVDLADVVPFPLASTLAERGAELVPAPAWQEHVVVSDRLVTGQNPASAGAVARAIVEAARAGG